VAAMTESADHPPEVRVLSVDGLLWDPARRAEFAREVGFEPVQEPVTVTYVSTRPANPCRVYWGSRGCMHPRGHSPEIPHECDCCDCENHPDPDSGCVARPPYYGEYTKFYGEDAEALGLPLAG